jgi:hypothetical protein
MFSTLWDTETVADADVWADYGDHAEDTWSDEADADESEDNLSDVEADSMTLASAGMGTDEDYGYYGGEDIWSDLGWDA